MTGPDFLDRLEEARKAATPGPWVIADWHPSTLLSEPNLRSLAADEPGEVRPPFMCTTTTSPADAELIVAAVNALPDLIRLARDGLALRAGVERLAEQLEHEGAQVTLTTGSRYSSGKPMADRLRAVVADTSGEA